MKFNLLKNFKYRVQVGDNLSLLCEKFNTNEEGILRNNKEIPLYAGEWVEITQKDFLTHIVKPTENLSTLAKFYDVDERELMKLNNLKDSRLFIGQHIKIAQIGK